MLVNIIILGTMLFIQASAHGFGICENRLAASTSGDGAAVATKFGTNSLIGGNHKWTKNNLPTPGMIRSEGYPVETHFATTDDGYILALHRIPHGRTNTGGSGVRPVVLLQHGLLCSSSDWVIQYRKKGLGYILADAGYDVWLGNFRGNTYSRNHTTLNPDKEQFWDFTWDEMAKYDLPATIDTILQISEQGDLLFIGHGMGASSFIAMNHYRPDITERVRLATFLAPTVYVENMESPLAWLAPLEDQIEVVNDLLGSGEFLPSSLWLDCLATIFCNNAITQGVCSNVFFLLTGPDSQQMNSTLIESILHHTPAGTSTRTLLHFAQEVNSGAFHGYDWGSSDVNSDHHDGSEIPVYRPEEFHAPTAVHWADNDWLAAVQDVERLLDELPMVLPEMAHHVDYPDWNHMDFLWGVDAVDYVYKSLLADMEHCAHFDCWQEAERLK